MPPFRGAMLISSHHQKDEAQGGDDQRVIARTYGEQSFKAGEKSNLGEEMADVLWVLLCLANQTGVNLEIELQKSIEKKTKRDAERHKNNSKLK